MHLALILQHIPRDLTRDPTHILASLCYRLSPTPKPKHENKTRYLAHRYEQVETQYCPISYTT